MNALLNLIASGPTHRAYVNAAEREREALMSELTQVDTSREAANDLWIGGDRAHESSATMMSLFGV